MSIFPPAPASHPAPARLDLKRKADAPVQAEREEPESVSTLHIRPGAAGTVRAPTARDARALQLQLSNASLVQTKGASPTLDEEGGPLAVEITGLRRQELNARYSVRQDVILHGRRTYWTKTPDGPSSRYFLAWQPTLGRWVVCERPAAAGEADRMPPDPEELERCAWQAFQMGQAATGGWTWVDLLEGCCWMERAETGWARAEGVLVSPAPPHQIPALRPPPVDSRPRSVDLMGFRQLDLNARYTQRPELLIHGKPTYWDSSRRFFLYWQASLRRWAICGNRALDAARQGHCPGCACQLDPVHFTASCRWAEYVDGSWTAVPVEVADFTAPPADGAAGAGGSTPSGEADRDGAGPAAARPRTLAAAFVKAALERTGPDPGAG